MPRVLSDSGGRSSGCMVILESLRGLAPDDYILFVNTGWEDNRTLDFIGEQQRHGLPVRILEYCPYNKWKEVSLADAARVDWFSTDADYLRAAIVASPFWRLIMTKYLRPGKPRTKKGHDTLPLFRAPDALREVLMVPNVASKFCTQELKIRVMRDFMRSEGHTHWEMVQGIRADEPGRLARGRNSKEPRWVNRYPLADAGIREPDVRVFWRGQPYDLQLESYEGNCRFCFEKAEPKRLLVLAETPVAGEVLAEVEEATGTTFTLGKPLRRLLLFAQHRTMKQLRAAVQAVPAGQVGCFCGD